jgi:hypothetical protein
MLPVLPPGNDPCCDDQVIVNLSLSSSLAIHTSEDVLFINNVSGSAVTLIIEGGQFLGTIGASSFSHPVKKRSIKMNNKNLIVKIELC